jgi:uncharacterized protein YlxW (UPF0749 family)
MIFLIVALVVMTAIAVGQWTEKRQAQKYEQANAVAIGKLNAMLRKSHQDRITLAAEADELDRKYQELKQRYDDMRNAKEPTETRKGNA